MDRIIQWLTGYSAEGLSTVLRNQTDFETFFQSDPNLNPARSSI